MTGAAIPAGSGRRIVARAVRLREALTLLVQPDAGPALALVSPQDERKGREERFGTVPLAERSRRQSSRESELLLPACFQCLAFESAPSGPVRPTPLGRTGPARGARPTHWGCSVAANGRKGHGLRCVSGWGRESVDHPNAPTDAAVVVTLVRRCGRAAFGAVALESVTRRVQHVGGLVPAPPRPASDRALRWNRQLRAAPRRHGMSPWGRPGPVRPQVWAGWPVLPSRWDGSVTADGVVFPTPDGGVHGGSSPSLAAPCCCPAGEATTESAPLRLRPGACGRAPVACPPW